MITGLIFFVLYTIVTFTPEDAVEDALLDESETPQEAKDNTSKALLFSGVFAITEWIFWAWYFSN